MLYQHTMQTRDKVIYELLESHGLGRDMFQLRQGPPEVRGPALSPPDLYGYADIGSYIVPCRSSSSDSAAPYGDRLTQFAQPSITGDLFYCRFINVLNPLTPPWEQRIPKLGYLIPILILLRMIFAEAYFWMYIALTSYPPYPHSRFCSCQESQFLSVPRKSAVI